MSELRKAVAEWARRRQAFIGVDFDANLNDEFRVAEEALIAALAESRNGSEGGQGTPGSGGTPEVRGDGEAWEVYAARLEVIIGEQRTNLRALGALENRVGDRKARKKIEALYVSLGSAVFKRDQAILARDGAVEKLRVVLDDLARADGGMTKSDDPSGEWVRFPSEVWDRLSQHR